MSARRAGSKAISTQWHVPYPGPDPASNRRLSDPGRLRREIPVKEFRRPFAQKLFVTDAAVYKPNRFFVHDLVSSRVPREGVSR